MFDRKKETIFLVVSTKSKAVGTQATSKCPNFQIYILEHYNKPITETAALFMINIFFLGKNGKIELGDF